jgi:hypothetical protein
MYDETLSVSDKKAELIFQKDYNAFAVTGRYSRTYANLLENRF